MLQGNDLRKIEVIGPESSGKSLLTSALAAKYETSHSEEFAVTFLTERGGLYEQNDIDEIAEGQLLGNIEATRLASGGWVFFDTGLLTIRLWSEIKFGSVSQKIVNLFDTNFPDHYLLCKPDLPWEFHPLREAPELADREAIFERHLRTLEYFALSYSIIEGEHRVRQAVDFLSGLKR